MPGAWGQTQAKPIFRNIQLSGHVTGLAELAQHYMYRIGTGILVAATTNAGPRFDNVLRQQHNLCFAMGKDIFGLKFLYHDVHKST